MSKLNICLILLNILFWVGHVAYYYRVALFRWFDARVPHEPVTNRLRAAFRPARR